MNHGGKRTAGPGKRIGRPTIKNAKVTVSVTLSPEVVVWLRSLDNTSQTIEAMVRQSKAFRNH